MSSRPTSSRAAAALVTGAATAAYHATPDVTASRTARGWVEAGLTAASVAGRIFRRGQARAASGKRLPHTGPALLYGALAGGLRLLPSPTDTH